jgi:SAM-dependent methyltransferase
MSRFDPEFYRRFRPYYPAELFAPLGRALAAIGSTRPYAIADIGCGTGHSTASLLRAAADAGLPTRVTGVDPDAAMLAAARELCPEARFEVGSGEATGLAPRAFDAVTVGSAFHWMDAHKAREEIARVLKPSGFLLVYEYQFPKARAHAELNEWIRREFNLRWKAPGQKPRGDFETVTGCFRGGSAFTLVEDRKVPMILKLHPADLTGLLLSQSRVLHHEATMSDSERAEFQKWLAAQMEYKLGPNGDYFDFSLQSAFFAYNFNAF